MDCSPPGSSVFGILQGRTLEWVVILFSRGSSQPTNWTQHCRQILYHLSHQGGLNTGLNNIWNKICHFQSSHLDWSLAKIRQGPEYCPDTPRFREGFVGCIEKIKILGLLRWFVISWTTGADKRRCRQRQKQKGNKNHHSGEARELGVSAKAPQRALHRATGNSRWGCYLQSQDYVFWLRKAEPSQSLCKHRQHASRKQKTLLKRLTATENINIPHRENQERQGHSKEHLWETVFRGESSSRAPTWIYSWVSWKALHQCANQLWTRELEGKLQMLNTLTTGSP